ncbi:MAG: alpha/beta hydrolase, partial [Oscillospiraceae bacterium]|nr:alpha/beta hydrolase [Oscillospiraceae bacterium]
EELRRITAPTLVIAGTKDLIRESETRRNAAAIPDSELVFIPGDHFIARRNPEAFNRAVLDFLAERPLAEI